MTETTLDTGTPRGFHKLTIASVRNPTDDSVALSFEIPGALRDTFQFIPGQYLTLRDTVGGEDIRRTYSICSAHDADHVEVGIKRVDGGRFSSHAMTLKAQQELLVMPPMGQFQAQLGGKHSYLLIAAGSGITPCLSIARSVLTSEPESDVTLIYGNRSAATTMFRQDINTLKDVYLERFSVLHILSREGQDVPLLNGRIDGERIALLAERGLINPASSDGIYVCGPQTMTDDVSKSLRAMDVEEDKIHFELFGTPETPQTKSATQDGSKNNVTVDIVIDGGRKQVPMDPAHETVLTAALAAGLDLPYSCSNGMCCTCRCRVVEGESTMDVNYSLQDWEVEAGFTLACQTRPTNDRLVLDFDAA
ncbi:MAG: 2Fe-2S iron-sulfur cluster-binding protein [Pseudomonadota bacterium]